MNIRDYLQRHIVIVGILIVVAGLVAASDTLHDRTDAIIVWTESVISQAPVLGMVLFVLLSTASAMVAFFSSAILAPVAIYAWGKAVTFMLLWLGWLLGGMLSFGIGRFLGRSVVSMIIDEKKIEGWERELGTRARFIHVLLFQAAVPSEIPGYVLGILRYSFPLYLSALAITELPYAIATVYLGEAFLEGNSTVFILLGITVIVLSMFLFQGIRKFLGQRKDS
ncbi:MAG: VTT domain-containing protein [Proteobacteria bacterium]|nr:VTT domain-containing protein [Pseudomonadota bacterium]